MPWYCWLALYYLVGLVTLVLGFFAAGEDWEWPDDVLVLVLGPLFWPVMAIWGYADSVQKGL